MRCIANKNLSPNCDKIAIAATTTRAIIKNTLRLKLPFVMLSFTIVNKYIAHNAKHNITPVDEVETNIPIDNKAAISISLIDNLNLNKTIAKANNIY